MVITDKIKKEIAIWGVLVMFFIVAGVAVIALRGDDFIPEYTGVAVNPKTRACFEYNYSAAIGPKAADSEAVVTEQDGLPTPSSVWQVYAQVLDSWTYGRGASGPLITPYGQCFNDLAGNCCRQMHLKTVAMPDGFGTSLFLRAIWFWGIIVLIVALIFIIRLIFFNTVQSAIKPKNKAAAQPLMKANNTSGQGKDATVPEELLGKFNWGAATMSYWWSARNGLSALEGMFWPSITLGWDGNALAWRNREWESVEEFQRAQRGWAKLGIGLWLGSVVVGILPLIYLMVIIGFYDDSLLVFSNFMPIIVLFGLTFFLARYFKPRTPQQEKAYAALSPEEKAMRKHRTNLWFWTPIIILIVLFLFSLFSN